MPKTRVMIVDDSAVVRKMIADVIETDPDLEVAALAPNGRIAMAKIDHVNPDIVTLDVEMPEMDGLATLRELRKSRPHMPVIMFSTMTERGAVATLDALAAGATDYITKPSKVASIAAATALIRSQLITRIKSLSPVSRRFASFAPLLRKPGASRRIDAVVIGVSTGGPNALGVVIPAIPATLGVPIFIVQHMPPVFTRTLAARLSSLSAIKVAEARGGDVASAGHALLAPGDYHMVASRYGAEVRALLNQDPPENSCRPAVDVLFRSVAMAYEGRVLAVVMTGMGQDGLRGCECVREAGGQVIAQDEATSVVWGMPGAIARAGLAEALLPLPHIASEIAVRVGRGAQVDPIASMRG